MSFGKLYGHAGNTRTIPILVTAKASDIDLELVKTFPCTNDPHNEYRKLNHQGFIPTFVGTDGFALTEAIAIAVYVASQNEKTTLLGENKQQFASILRWMSFANHEVIPPLSGWFRPFVGFERYNKKAVEDFTKTTHERLAFLETHLTRHTYLVGDSLSLADIFLAGVMTRGFASVLDNGVRAKYTAFMRWHSTITDQPFYKAVNQPVLVDEARKFDLADEGEEAQGKD